MRQLLILFLIVFSINIKGQIIKIAAAGNLRFTLEDIKTRYIKLNPGTVIEITIGSSGALFQQISNGEDFDIFMSADRIYPDKLKTQRIISSDVQVYAYGMLVMWSNTLDLSKGVNILTESSVHRISIAKPEVAPYGERAIECLKYYNIFDKVKNKIVYADNISQAAQYVQTGNAEVGFIAQALTVDPDMKGSVYILDEKSYKPIEQALVILKSGNSNPEAMKFVKFLFSNDCKLLFEKYGFKVP